MRPHPLFFLLLGLAACVSSPQSVTNPVQFNPTNQTEYVQAVNSVRSVARVCSNQSNSSYPKGSVNYPAAAGLSWNGILGEVARQRANYLEQNKVALNSPNAHSEGADTTPFATRATNNGYVYIKIGENLASGYSNPPNAVSGWLISQAGHCNALMDNTYSQFGMAQAKDYWVLILGKPQN